MNWVAFAIFFIPAALHVAFMVGLFAAGVWLVGELFGTD